MPILLDQPDTPRNNADLLWVLLSSAAVLLMSPACGYFYSGTVEFKNAVSLVLFSFISYALVSVQWYLWGFSKNNFIGDLSYAAASGDKILNFNYAHPLAPTIPMLGFFVWQGMFAAVTLAIAFGAVAERLRVFPFIVFGFLWSTFVYDIVAYWVWAPGGWLYQLGFKDFAGGAPVHIVAGASGLALCIALGKRSSPNATPHNLPLMSIGTVLFWFGWVFFNGGSANAINARALISFFNTNLAAGFGGLAWIFFDYRIHKKYTSLGFCSGVIAGLVCVTPGSGFIHPHWAIIFAILGSIAANLACFLKSKLNYDDTLDTFPVHCVAGAVGLFLTGIFAQEGVQRLGGDLSRGGAIDGNPRLIGIQIAGILATFVWSFGITFLLAKGMSFVPALNLRVSQEEETIGCDITLCGEVSYDFTNSGARIGDYAQNQFK